VPNNFGSEWEGGENIVYNKHSPCTHARVTGRGRQRRDGCITGDEDKPPQDISPVARWKKCLKKKKKIIIKAPCVFGSGYNIMQMGPLPDGNMCAYTVKERVVGMSTYLNMNTNRMQIKMPQRSKPSPVFSHAVPMYSIHHIIYR